MRKYLKYAAFVSVVLSISAAYSQQYSLPGPTIYGPITPGNCAEWFSVWALEDSGGPCGGAGSSAWNALTSGTNTTGTFVIGTGASLAATGSGTIAATNTTGVNGAAVPTSATVVGANSSGQIVADTTSGSGSVVLATSPTLTTPALGTPSSVNLANATALPFGVLTGSTNTAAAMVVGSGASLSVTGTGTIGATSVTGLTIASGKTLTANNSLTLAGTDATTQTFPATSQTIAGLGTAETWSALQAFGTNISIGGVTATGATGTGNAVFGTSPTLTTPALGIPSAVTLTNAAGLPISTGVSGLGTGVATFLATPTSANLAAATTDETGTGALVFATSPTLVTPTLGAATATSINGNTFTTGTYTLTGSTGKTLNFTNSLTLSGTDGTTMTFPATSDTVVTLAATQTLTNKSIAGSEINSGTVAGANIAAISLSAGNVNGGVVNALPLANGGMGTIGVNSVSTATSVTPNCTYGMVKIAASSTGTFTVNAPGTCTPFDGQKLTLKVTSPAGGTITYSWNATYLASATLALPSTSNAASKEDYFGFQWDADKSGWVFLAANQGF